MIGRLAFIRSGHSDGSVCKWDALFVQESLLNETPFCKEFEGLAYNQCFQIGDRYARQLLANGWLPKDCI